MTKSTIKIRFEKSRKDLSQALKDLEESIKEKLHDTASQSRMIGGISENDAKNNQAALLEKNIIIENLNSEINNLQNNLLDLGNENDFLSKENKAITARLEKLNHQQVKIIKSIEEELIKIEKIIN